LLKLRWQLFRNSLRFRNRSSELVVQGIGYAFMALLALGASVGLFFATFALLGMDKPQILGILLWAIFLLWQVVPVLVEGYSPGINFNEIARYPVSFRLYFLLNASYGLFDPAALTGLLWLLSIWLGIVAARPEWAIAAAALFAVFAVFNVLCNRFVITLLERYQSTRKGRERMAAILLVLIFLPQLIQLAANGWIDVHHLHPPAWTRGMAIRLHELSPPGQVSRILTLPGAEKLFPAGFLLAYVLVVGWLLARRLRAVYQGEIYAERPKVKRDFKIKPGWRFPALDEKTSAIVEKELRYLRQNSRLLVQLAYPVILFALIALGGPGRKIFAFNSTSGILGVFAGLMALAVSNLSYNAFGMDREGFGRWLLSPLPLEKVLIAKNLAQGAILSAFYLAGTIVILRAGNVSWTMFVAVTCGFFSMLIIQMGAGNVISVRWPKRIELTKISSRTASGAAGFMSMAFTLPMLAVIAIVVFATVHWKLMWLPLVAGMTGLVLALALYFLLLNRAVRYAGDHLEEIAGQLGA
jgi:hypothetical protein